MTEQCMMEQRMTEQNGHEEREQNSARDGDAGFAALEATEPHFGSSALGNFVSFEPVAPPVEVDGFEALNFERPRPWLSPPSAGRCLPLLHLLLLKSPRMRMSPHTLMNPHTLMSLPMRANLPTRTNLRIRQSLRTLKQSTQGNIGYPRTKRHSQKQ